MPLWTIFTKCPAPAGADVGVAVLGRQRREDRLEPLRPPRRRRRPSGSSRPRGPRCRRRRPQSTKWMPLLGAPRRGAAASRGSSSCRRRRSCRRLARARAASWNVSSVIFPAGTIIQNARGASSWSRSSSSVAGGRVDAGVVRLHVVPGAASSRVVMLPPMRPRPIIPSCISSTSSRRMRATRRPRSRSDSKSPAACARISRRSRTAGPGSSARRRSPRRPAGRGRCPGRPCAAGPVECR